jgi:hypothetical protein
VIIIRCICCEIDFLQKLLLVVLEFAHHFVAVELDGRGSMVELQI